MVRDKTIRTLTSSSSPPTSLPTLPFDLIPEILCRLPVKFLLQYRCVCRSWKSLISDPKFAKKHLILSTKQTLHCISYFYKHSDKHVLKSYSLDSVLTNITQTQFRAGSNVFFVGSCNGILCLVRNCAGLVMQVQLWNPSIRKFKELPPIDQPPKNFPEMYGFGYDPISDNYKAVVVFYLTCDDFTENEVNVHTLGTDSWKSVSKFRLFAIVSIQLSGQYASGTINWLVSTRIKSFIASFDLGNECYQEVLLPGEFGEVDKNTLRLSVLRDCLCMISGKDVWVMKEYGNKESWTKLFTIPHMRDPFYPYIKAICVFEDEQVLLRYIKDKRWVHISYNYKNDTSSKFIEFEDTPDVCIESLISPCFKF